MYSSYEVSAGQTVKDLVLDVDELYVYSGGTARNITISAASTETVHAGGSTISTTISSGGSLYVEGGTAIKNTIASGGKLFAYNGANITSTKIYSGGNFIYEETYNDNREPVCSTTINKITVLSGATFSALYNATVTSAVISNGGVLQVGSRYDSSLGLTVTSNFIKSGGSMIVYDGTVSKTVVSKGGYMEIGNSDDIYYNYGNPIATSTTVKAGGTFIANGGQIEDLTINKGAQFSVSAGTLSKVTLKSGASANLYGADIYGTLTAKGATVRVLGANNVTNLQTDAKTKIKYDISLTNPNPFHHNINTALLHCTVKKAVAGTYSVNAAKNQMIGTYYLSTNNNLAAKKSFALSVNDTKIGSLALNGKSLTKNGVTYTLAKGTGVNTAVTLNLALKAGKMLKGTTANDKLTGNTNCDIFYGNSGNDTITGVNGRDVTVYDMTDWGKDTIKATNGTMTVLFKDIKSFDVTTKIKGSDMVITRNGYTNQQVTIKNWSDESHNIVFGGLESMPAFDKYLQSAKPTTAITSAARNEVWSAAQLA